MQMNAAHIALDDCSRWVYCAARSALFGRTVSKEREQVFALRGLGRHRVVSQSRAAPMVRNSRNTKADSPGYFETIARNLAGKNPESFTLAAIDKSTSKITGYVYCCLPGDACGRAFEGACRISTPRNRHHGTMLLDAGQIQANQRGWGCRAKPVFRAIGGQ